MSVLKQNKFEDDKCDLYNPEGEFLWTIESQLELNDIRLQIKEKSLEGYYLIFKDQDEVEHRIEVSKNGYLSNWPEGFYDNFVNQLRKL